MHLSQNWKKNISYEIAGQANFKQGHVQFNLESHFAKLVPEYQLGRIEKIITDDGIEHEYIFRLPVQRRFETERRFRSILATV